MALSEEDKQEIDAMIRETETELSDAERSRIVDEVSTFRAKTSMENLIGALGFFLIGAGLFIALSAWAFYTFSEAQIKQVQPLVITGEKMTCSAMSTGALYCYKQ